MMKIDKAPVPLIVPNPDDPRLTQSVTGTDQSGAKVEIKVPMERPLTLYLNSQEIVTMMTIGDYPEYLALGYLLNQNMLKYNDAVTEVEYDDDLQVVVVRTEHNTNFEAKLKKRTQTSGCAQGTAFGDLLEAVESVALPKAELRTSWLYQMTQAINTMPSLYLEAGAIHGFGNGKHHPRGHIFRPQALMPVAHGRIDELNAVSAHGLPSGVLERWNHGNNSFNGFRGSQSSAASLRII